MILFFFFLENTFETCVRLSLDKFGNLAEEEKETFVSYKDMLVF